MLKTFKGEITGPKLKLNWKHRSAGKNPRMKKPRGRKSNRIWRRTRRRSWKSIPWSRKWKKWVHRGEQGPTNFGIGWSQNHRWGKEDEQGKVDKLEQGTEANSGTKDQGTELTQAKNSRYRS
ncbi:hypothetical protein HYD58_03790 [Mycoplasmopsis bovis]|nr:hypothetical protein [Mycoplasmopsis bovis]QQH66185.1 hypothetical protein HYD58_03790 [Mycoplasmopsis bovis]